MIAKPKKVEKKNLWRACCGAMVVLSIVSFTPLIIPAGQYAPMLAGLPLTLWTGMLVSAVMVLLTLAGALVHPTDDDEERPLR